MTRRSFVTLVSLISLSLLGCRDGARSADPCGATSVPFDVGDPNGHPEPLASAPGEARAGRVEASELVATPSGLATWEPGDFVLANDRIAMVIEDADDSDYYDPWGGKPVGFAHVQGAAMVEASDFGEMLIFAYGPSSVVTEHVGVLSDGSDGGPAIVRAEGRIHAIPFVRGLIGVFWPGTDYRDDVTRLAIDYVLEPDSEHVDVYVRIKHQQPGGTAAQVTEAVGFMYSDRLRVFQPDENTGFDSGTPRRNDFLAMVDERGVGYAFEVPGERLSPLPSASGFSGAFHRAHIYPGCEVSADEPNFYGRIHIGGPDADALLDVVARSRGTATRAITGRVEGASAVGRAGVRVHAVTSGTLDQYLTRTTTDASGNFTLHVPSDATVDLYAFEIGEALIGPLMNVPGSGPVMLTMPGMATVHVAPAVDGNASPIPYKIQVIPADGATTIPTPPNARWGEEMPTTGRLHVVHSLANEAHDLALPPGQWKVVVTRGFRYEPDEATFIVASGDSVSFAPVLVRAIDTPGVFCADFHIHTRRSNDSGDDEILKLRAGLAEDLDIPVRSDHEYVEDWDDVITGPLASGQFALGVTSVELSTMEYFGHFGVLPAFEDTTLPNGGTPLWQDFPTSSDLDRPSHDLSPTELFARVHARAEDPIVIVNHPMGGSNYFGWTGYDPVTGTADPARWSDDFEAIEVFNSADWVGARNGTVRAWLSFLNRGVRVPAVGSSDTHGVMGSPMGYDRTCLDFNPVGMTSLPQDATTRRAFGYVLRDAVVAGRSSVNGGVFVDASVAGVSPGGTATSLTASNVVHVNVRALSFIDVDTIEIVVDGAVASTIDVANDCTQNGVVRCDQDFPISVGATNSYVVVAAYGNTTMEPLMRGRIPFGVTNPIYLER